MKNESEKHEQIDKEIVLITTQLLRESGQPFKTHIKLNDSLQALGIDSLGRATLFDRIEKHFSVSIPDRLLAEAETLNDIVIYLKEGKPSVRKSIERQVVTSHGEISHVDPSQVKTIIETILLYAEKSPNKIHVYFQKEDGSEEPFTYQQLLTSSLQVAFSLKEGGLQEGETVAIMLPTTLGFFYTFLGTLLAGGIPVPIYPPFRMHMLEAYAKTEARILNNAEVRMLVTFEEAKKLSQLLKAFVPSLKSVTTVDELLQAETLKSIFQAKADNFAFIQYTSGSTADPKGVLLTHANLLANIRAYGHAINVKPDDVAVSWLPLYHDMGLIGMWLGSLYYGVPLVLLTPFTFLNHPERWLWAIHYHRGTLSGAPNFAYELCVNKIDPAQIEGLDLSSWRMAANGAEKVYPRTLNDFANKFAPYGFKRSALLPVYGLAESTVALTIPSLDREFRVDTVDRKLFEAESKAEPSTVKNALSFVSCGIPLQGHQVRIVDDNNNVLPERHVGRLQFRGPSSMQGYYNNPLATQSIYHAGWIDSGDLAYSADGEFFITGRSKDLIIKAGRNIYPAEIEELVGNIHGIRRGCVVAFSANNANHHAEQLVVVAETKETEQSKRENLTQAIKEAITSQLDIIPDHIALVPPHIVPKTSSGKLQRAACKKLFLEGHLGKKPVPAWMQITKLFFQSALRNMGHWLDVCARFFYTLYIVCVFILTFIPMYIVILLSSGEFAAKVCKFWARLLLTLSFCPMRIIGQKKLTKFSPVIYTANHSSYIDAIVGIAFVPVNTVFIVKKELFSVPFLRTFLRKLNYLAVDRMDLTKGIEDTKKIEQILKDGRSIFIFPEGTFGYFSGLRPFRLGAFKMASETKTPICPIAIRGTRGILRSDEKLMRPGRIQVTVCHPILPHGSEWQDVTQLRNIVRARIARYCGEPLLDFIAAQTVADKPPERAQ